MPYPIKAFFEYNSDNGGKYITIWLDKTYVSLRFNYFKKILNRRYQVGNIWYKTIEKDDELFVIKL